MTIDTLKTEAALLPKIEKLELLRHLAELIADDEANELCLDGLDQQELDARWREIENGTAKTVSAKDVTSKLRAKYGL